MVNINEMRARLESVAQLLSSGDLSAALAMVEIGYPIDFYHHALAIFGAYHEVSGMIEILKAAQAHDPSFPEKHDRLVLQLAEGQVQLRQCPPVQMPSPELQMKLAVAESLAYRGRFGPAITICLELVPAAPDNAPLLVLLGTLFRIVGSEEQSIQCIDTAVLAAPSLVAARYLRAAHLRGKQVCDDELVDEIQALISLTPSEPEPYHTLSELHYLRGDYKAADLWTKKGVEMQLKEARRLGLESLGVRLLGRHWTPPIGHIAALGVLARLSAFDLLPYRPVVLGFAVRTGNPALLDYFEQFFPIVRNVESAAPLIKLEKHLGMHISGFMIRDAFKPLYEAWSDSVELWEKHKGVPLLTLSEKHRVNGERALSGYGFPEGGWFVTMHVRESFEEWSGRNSSIDDYLSAIQEITSRGGWVIRIGNSSMKKLPALPNVVDYAHASLQSPELDVFFCGACRFFIASASGPSSVPSLFDVPVLATNYSLYPLQTRPSFDVYMPKLCRQIRDQRFLTFSECAQSQCANIDNKARLANLGFELIDNSAEEIREAVVEMLQRTEGRFKLTEEEARLQLNLKSCLKPVGKIRCDIASSFAQNYQNLIC